MKERGEHVFYGAGFGCSSAGALLNPLFYSVSSQQQTQLVRSHFARNTTQDTNPRQQHIENKAIREVMKREKHTTQ